MNLEGRMLLWKIHLGILCILLLLLIPVTMACVLVSQYYTYPFEVFLTSIFVMAFQLCLWWIGLIFPITLNDSPKQLFISFFSYPSLQAYVARLSVIGTCLSAMITAFGSVSFPVEQIIISSGIDSKLILSREKSWNQFVQTIASKKKDDVESNRKRDNIKRELVLMEAVADELFSDILTMKGLNDQVSRMSTLKGRLDQGTGYIMFVAGVFRFFYCVWKCSVGLHGYRSETVIHRGTSNIIYPSVGSGTGMQFLFGPDTWIPYTAVLFIIVSASLSTRSFLIAFKELRNRVKWFRSVSADLYAILLSAMAIPYFLACALMLSIRLPARCKPGMSFHLETNLHIDFYLWFFDTVFCVSMVGFVFYYWLDHVRKTSLTTFADFDIERNTHFNSRYKD